MGMTSPPQGLDMVVHQKMMVSNFGSSPDKPGGPIFSSAKAVSLEGVSISFNFILPTAPSFCKKKDSPNFCLKLGGVNPFEKIGSSNWIISPKIGVKIKHVWNQHLWPKMLPSWHNKCLLFVATPKNWWPRLHFCARPPENVSPYCFLEVRTSEVWS